MRPECVLRLFVVLFVSGLLLPTLACTIPATPLDEKWELRGPNADWSAYRVYGRIFFPIDGRDQAGDRSFTLRHRLPENKPEGVAILFYDVNRLVRAEVRDREGARTIYEPDSHRPIWPIALTGPYGADAHLYLICVDPRTQPEGIMRGVYYGSLDEVQRRLLLSDIDTIVLGSSFCLLAIGLLVLAIVRRSREILALALLVICAALLMLSVSEILGYMSGRLDISSWIADRIAFFLFAATPIVMEQSLGAGPYRLVRRTWQVLLSVAILNSIVRIIPGFVEYSIIGVGALIVGGYLIYLSYKGDTYARIFAIGLLIFCLAGINDSLKQLRLVPQTVYLVHWGVAGFIVCVAVITSLRFAEARRRVQDYAHELERTNTALARFVPREFLTQLGKSSIADIRLGDQVEQDMTVVFTDIRGFTGLSEKMSPAEVFSFLNDYMGLIGPVVRAHDGFIDKYVGDAIMALFPEPERAVSAALAMQNKLDEWNQHRVRQSQPEIRTGIGIHCGHLMLGTVGEEERMDSTVISDVVNVASRLEGLTRDYEANIIISSPVRDAIQNADSFALKLLGSVTVKGRLEAIEIYSAGRA